MNTSKSKRVAKFCIAFSAAFLAITSISLAYQAGCAQNAAGNTEQSLDLELLAVWLMIPSLILVAVLFAAPAGLSLVNVTIRIFCLLLIGIPAAFCGLFYTENVANQACMAKRIVRDGALTEGSTAISPTVGVFLPFSLTHH